MAKPRKIKDKIIELRKKGLSYNEISRQLNCSKGSISYHCQREKLNPDTNDLSCLKSKMVEMKMSGISLPKISNELGCSLSTVKKYCKGITAPGKERSCVTCGTKLTDDNCYYNNRGKMHSNCKKCNTKLRNLSAKETKRLLIKYKGGKCERCGYNKCVAALELHHRDPSQKEFRLSSRLSFGDETKAEADKCDLLCANCHREVHYEMNNPSHSELK